MSRQLRRSSLLLAVVASTAWPGALWASGFADGVPQRFANVGVTFGYTFAGPDTGPTLGVDATLGSGTFWGSIGTRLVFANHGLVKMPYAEGGAAASVAVGLGWTVVVGGKDGYGGPHVIVGVPYPIVELDDDSALTTSLYYRLGLQTRTAPGARSGAIHEFSTYLKYFRNKAWADGGR